ncbi:hypothetical protein G3N55_01465 [Dissulfurirhabdus thermomarina]|uniref:Doubled CXXCH motif domain-containing protein n=1 Tax=Dissulfurirhabdus thermomarina TaxID=1765737 RepID=A0A6N9TJT5_DISTH|nr:cytochrome c3 family protein [Dissulfurirhabdus thermomarina]NDY41522.1 hypothetical protein [Dissulfurirhabdus thermomarina]NMX22959.1 hypothetical protein [Dissulfurirhabdus thermomarina]
MNGTRCGVFLALAAVLAAAPAAAKVTGPCAACHTMHNSQNGLSVVGGGPIPGLLNADCLGCHTGSNAGGTTPYVFSQSAPAYGTSGTEATTTTLAGGNFYWVANGNPRAGHNVQGAAPPDPDLGNTPPGGTALSTQLNCAGTNGCHGRRSDADPYRDMFGAHHQNDMTGWKDGTSLARSYRFLMGVQGLEDAAYEFRPTAAGHHNKYYGVDRATEADAAGTLSSLCGSCHGDFHHGTGQVASGTFGAGAWLRHPTDFDMSRATTSGEYAGYNGGGGTGNPYSVVSPVATSDTSTTLNTTVYSQAGDAVVMCASCHRAHGTPFAYALRWDYRSWPGGGTNGCAVCHTSKD